MKNNLIEVRNLSFGYHNQLVLKDLSFEIKEGDLTAIIGPNGSGKSTLVKLLLGLFKPRTGTITFGNAEIRRQMGYVSQVSNRNQNFPATVKEVVASGLSGKLGFFQWMNQARWQQVDQALQKVDLLPLKNRNIGKLSGGQRQRVFIARALVSQPKLLILDEPTVGIDVGAKDQFYRLLKQLHQKNNLSIVWVTHDMEKVTEISDRIICLNRRLIFYGSVTDYVDQEHHILFNLFRLG